MGTVNVRKAGPVRRVNAPTVRITAMAMVFVLQMASAFVMLGGLELVVRLSFALMTAQIVVLVLMGNASAQRALRESIAHRANAQMIAVSMDVALTEPAVASLDSVAWTAVLLIARTLVPITGFVKRVLVAAIQDTPAKTVRRGFALTTALTTVSARTSPAIATPDTLGLTAHS